ncbi:MAG: hypothetical protein ACRDOA_03830 [Streptosporangiaceae bacterium]
MPRHDRDAGGPAEVLAAKAALRQQVWSATEEKIAAIPLLAAQRWDATR